MKVYIAIHHDERDAILGVFSTREVAERAKKRRGNYQQYDARTVDIEDDPDTFGNKYDSAVWAARSDAIEWSEAVIHEYAVEGTRRRTPREARR